MIKVIKCHAEIEQANKRKRIFRIKAKEKKLNHVQVAFSRLEK